MGQFKSDAMTAKPKRDGMSPSTRKAFEKFRKDHAETLKRLKDL